MADTKKTLKIELDLILKGDIEASTGIKNIAKDAKESAGAIDKAFKESDKVIALSFKQQIEEKLKWLNNFLKEQDFIEKARLNQAKATNTQIVKDEKKALDDRSKQLKAYILSTAAEEKALSSARAKETSEYLKYAKAMLQARTEADPLLRNELKLQIELNRVTSSYSEMIATTKQRYTEFGMSMEVMHTEVKKLLTEEAKQIGIITQEYEKKSQVVLVSLVKQKLQEEQLVALVKEQEASKLAQVKERLDNEVAYWKQVKARELQYETDTRKAIEKGWEETFKLREEQTKRLNLLQTMGSFKATPMSFASSDNKQASDKMLAGMSASYQLAELAKAKAGQEAYTVFLQEEEARRVKLHQEALDKQKFEDQANLNARKIQVAAFIEAVEAKEKEEVALQKEVEAQMLKLKENFLFLQNKAEWQKLQDFKLVEEAMLRIEQDKVASEKKLEQELTDYKKLKLEEQRKYAEQEANDELSIRQRELEAIKKSMLASSVSAGVVGNSQQTLLAESRQRLAILDEEYKLKAARTKYGEDSNQAIRQQAANRIVEIEQRMADRLANIQEKVLTGKRTEEQGLAQSTKLIKQYQEQIAHQKELTRSTEQLKIAHTDLWQFIGKSMIIWRAYNFVLSETSQLMLAIPKVGMELETTKSILSATMGGHAGAEVALRGLHEEAKRTGIEISALRETWRTFSASTTIAGESLNTSWTIFTKMNTVITALHYSGDKASHIFMALSQMFNKGKIQSEELVKQLGNLLPGAFAAMAAATNHSTTELVSLMKKGQFMATGNLEQFADYYSNRFAGAFIPASKSLNSELGRMKTAFSELAEALYAKAAPALIGTSKGLTDWLDKLKDSINGTSDLSASLEVFVNSFTMLKTVFSTTSGVFGLLGDAAKGLINNFHDSIAALASMYLAYRAFMPISAAWVAAGGTIVGALTAIKASILSINPALAAISATIAIGVYFDSKTEHFDKEKTIAQNLDNVIAKLREKLIAEEPLPLKIAVDRDSSVKEAKAAILDIRDRIAALEELKKVTAGKANKFQEVLLPASIPLKPSKFEGLIATAGVPSKLVDDMLVLKLPQLEARLAAARLDLKDLQESELKAREAASSVQLGKLGAVVDVEGLTRATTEIRNLKKAWASALPDDTIDAIKKKTANLLDSLTEQFAEFTPEVLPKTKEKLVKDIEATRNALASKDFTLTKQSKEYLDKTLEGQLAHQNTLLEGEKLLADRTQQIVEESNKKIEALNKASADHALQLQEKTIANAKKLNDSRVKDAEEFAGKEQNRIDNELKLLSKTDLNRTVEDNQRRRNALLDKQIVIQDRLITQLKELNKEQTSVASLSGTSDATSSRGSSLDLELLKASKSKQHSFDFAKVDAAFKEASKTSGVDEYIIKALAKQESGFNRNAKSPVGAEGFMQFMPDTAKQYGVNVKDEVSSILGTGNYLKDAMVKFDGDIRKVIASYNTGIRNVATHDINLILSNNWARNKKTGVGETKQYVQNILGFADKGKGTNSSEDKEAYAANLATQEKKREDLVVQRQLSDEEGIKQLKERISLVDKMQSTYEAAYGIVGSASAKFYEDTKLEAERMALLYKEGDTGLTKLADGYFKNRDAVLELMKAKENLANIENKSIVNLNQYKVALQDLDRLQNAGMSAGISAMLERDNANKAQLPDLQAKIEAEQAMLSGGRFGSVGGDAYTEQFKKIEALKASMKDLSITSQSTMLFAAQTIGSAFDTTFRGLLDGSIKAKDAFKQFGLSVIKTLQDIILQELKSQIIKLAFRGLGALSGLGATGASGDLSGTIGGGGSSLFANGGAFNNGNIVPFAKGGIVSQPTLFKFAKGTGLMGEAGAEAIMPLARDASGKLGVKNLNGNSNGNAIQANSNIYNINVNVQQAANETADTTGLKIAQAAMQAIAQAEIAKAQKPGNSLNRITKFG